jgi:hypothetical protein
MAPQPTPPAKSTDPAVEAELDRLAVMPIAQLRVRYQEVPGRSAEGVRARPAPPQRGASDSGKGLWRPLPVYATPARPDDEGILREAEWQDVLPRRIKPGSVLVREWKGRSHRVMVLADGFAYDGNTYGNLSEIAGLITGTRWNGPRFFGLRSKADESSKPTNAGCARDADQGSNTAPLRSSHLGGGSDYRKRNADIARKSAARGGPHGR